MTTLKSYVGRKKVTEPRPEFRFFGVCSFSTEYSTIKGGITRCSLIWSLLLLLLLIIVLLLTSVLLSLSSLQYSIQNIQFQFMFLYSNRLHIYLWVSLHDPCSLDSSEGEPLLPKAHSHPLLITPLHFLFLPSSSCSLVTSINIYFKLSFQRYTGDSGLALADGLRGQLS